MAGRSGQKKQAVGAAPRRSRAAGRGGGPRQVVVVESTAKAKTIGAWLGPPYRVMATRGHVRDLPSKAGSVDPGDGFLDGLRDRQGAGPDARVDRPGAGECRGADPRHRPGPGGRGDRLAGAGLAHRTGRDRRQEGRARDLSRGDRRGGPDGARQSARDRHGPGPGVAGAPGARLPGGLRPVAGAVAQAAGLPLGGPGAVGGAAPDLRARGRDRGLRAAAILDRRGRGGGEGRYRLRGDACAARRDRDRRGRDRGRSGGAGTPPGASARRGSGRLSSSATPCTGRPTRRSRPRPCSWRRSAGSASGSARPWRSPSGSTRASTSGPRPRG